jgi:hypothetical protein
MLSFRTRESGKGFLKYMPFMEKLYCFSVLSHICKNAGALKRERKRVKKFDIRGLKRMSKNTLSVDITTR